MRDHCYHCPVPRPAMTTWRGVPVCRRCLDECRRETERPSAFAVAFNEGWRRREVTA